MLNQPPEDIKLPISLERAIERTKGLVALGEEELSKQRSLLIRQKAEINANILVIKEQEAKIKELGKLVADKERQSDELEEAIEDASERLIEIEREVTRLSSIAEASKVKQEEEKASIQSEIKRLSEVEIVLRNRERLSLIQAEELDKREEKIKNFASSLK